MLKINKVSLVDNQFTDEELKTGGLCELTAAGTQAGKGVWHFVKDGTATCVAAETYIPGDDKQKGFSCKVEELVLKLTKTVRREIPIAAGKTTVDTGLKGLTKATKDGAHSTIGEAITLTVETDEKKKGQITLSAPAAEASVLVVDLEVTVGEGKASHPSMDPEHELELKAGEPLHVVLYANAKNLEGAKLNVTDFHTRSSRIGITNKP